MIGDRSVLALVPARSGSKGIPHKNMRQVGGMSLIARAGETLRNCTTVDAALISTDSQEYADEGRRHGLDAWFLRPAELSTDTATAVDTSIHAVLEAERHYGRRFDVILIVEPTSPLRRSQDIDDCARLLESSGAQSVVTVSRINSKNHPRKLLCIESGALRFFHEQGSAVSARQQLGDELFYRNGICYALQRSLLVQDRVIFGSRTLPMIIDRPLVNIDEPLELELAEFLLQREARA
jgi:CMP-N,N'-diacetyllegionaminic acid synthase